MVSFVATWKATCGTLWDCFTRYTNPQLVVKCDQILCVTSCEFDKWAAKPKFVAESRPALCNSQQQVDHNVNNSKYQLSFCIEYIITALKEAIYEIWVIVSPILPPLEHSALL